MNDRYDTPALWPLYLLPILAVAIWLIHMVTGHLFTEFLMWVSQVLGL